MGNARGAFYARPSASQRAVVEKRQVEEVDLSFLCPPFVCRPPIAAGVVSSRSSLLPLRDASTIDASLIFARGKPCHFSLALCDKLEQRIRLVSLNLAS